MRAPVSAAISRAAASTSALRLKSLGRAYDDMAAEQRSSHHQRVRHVVAVSNIRQPHFAQVAKLFLQGEKIRQRLAGMLVIAQSIDHRDRCRSAPTR